ncbi:hypothetical protein PITCH_A1100008 [uncultured Desulfobacterium sp.]|uniref:Uncharacterized protein n=1 Tax=uncultured Desulfobacterium sp. TaxID=201089 RepID=A0A445MR62_9BACT|nr:hypothetical protein PITCH_A1100008 [uncultured Desulfobacterium sp.]
MPIINNLFCFTWHVYSEPYLDHKWVKTTPAFDLQTCETNGFIPVAFDGLNNAILPSHYKHGNLHIEYLPDALLLTVCLCTISARP